MRPIPEAAAQNLSFLIAEISAQLSNLQDYFHGFSPTLAQRIIDRRGYAHNLALRIHDSCLRQLAEVKPNEVDAQLFRSLETIATKLETIAELCRETIHQIGFIKDRERLQSRIYIKILDRVSVAIGNIEEAIGQRDIQSALKIGRVEQKLDRLYQKQLKAYTTELRQGKQTEDLIAALFVGHGIERMGDALLSISEAIISASLGQPFNAERLNGLRASVAKLDGKGKADKMVLEPIAETRSGHGISGLSHADDDGYVAIFKDGQKRKLKEERQGVENWHEIYPGLAPRILSYHKRGESAALLIEHLAGLTFEQILLHEPRPLLADCLDHLCGTLESVWRETRSKKAVNARHMQQLSRRMPDVFAIHPEFNQGRSQICGQGQFSFSGLVEKAAEFEKKLRAPFSVYIHGDFNVDNIIYDPLEQRINFIDLHRSRYMDYVQDISVFMVSNFRLQVMDAPLRQRILEVTRAFYRFAAKYARKSGDRSFELRLALGLARSFATSTRFILDKSLARAMFLRARYLLERLLAADPKRPADFNLPIEELFRA